jgi:hypothetical protein
MADLTITATGVVKGTGAQTKKLLVGSGVTITQGCLMYEDSSVSPAVWRLADCNASLVASKATAIALSAGSPGQPVEGQFTGQITIGATVAVGTPYWASTTAGSITSTAPASGSWATFVGFGITAAIINITFVRSGVQVP